MKQRYNNLSHLIITRAVCDWADHKWKRKNITTFIEEWAGVSRRRILEDVRRGVFIARNEAVDNIALALEDMIEEIMDGKVPDRIAPPRIRHLPDGMTGKIREIALLDEWHQLLGHVAVLLLEPLFRAKILPQQHASIPGRGQTGLKRQVAKYLRSADKITVAQKTDVYHAYASTSYAVCIQLIKRDIPSAMEVIRILECLGKLAPDGHLIIGGYVDAWLFNYIMSYVLREAIRSGRTRRGKFYPYAYKAVSYMDDTLWLSDDATKVSRAIRAAGKALDTFGLLITQKQGATLLLSSAEEHRRKRKKSPARRACPHVDMGGYEISRTHIRIRAGIFLRARRTWLRAWDALRSRGHIGIQTARRIMAYRGYAKQSNSKYIASKYHLAELKSAAAHTISRYARRKATA